MNARRTLAIAVAALALAGVLAGCMGPTVPGGDSASGGSAVPEAFKADEAKAVELAVTAEGGGVAVATGDATAAVSVPPGAAQAGSKWKVVPLTENPSGVKKPLSLGVYVDTSGGVPTGPCAIGFSLPGTASPDATIVKISEDGKSTTIVPTQRITWGGRTLLTASVDGFSPYTTSEEDAAARDKAYVDKQKAKGKSVDWTIKAGGTETQDVQGWKMTYELDLFASGGDEGMGGVYKGHAALFIKGKYALQAGPVKGVGKIDATGRDEALSFFVIDAPLADLLTGASVGDPVVGGAGVMHLKGMGSLNAVATGPTVKGSFDKTVTEGSPVAFMVKVSGEDVQIEIANAGIFPGKILRTSK